MKTRHIRTLVSAWALCSAVFLCASHAQAATLWGTACYGVSLVNGTNTNCPGIVSNMGSGGGSSFTQPGASYRALPMFGSTTDVVSQTISGIQIEAATNGTPDPGDAVQLVVFNCGSVNGTYSLGTEGSLGINATLSFYNIPISLTMPSSFPSNCQLDFTDADNGNVAWTTLSDGSYISIYFQMYQGSAPPFPLIFPSSSSFIKPYIPANQTATSSNVIKFSAQYYFNCEDFGLYDSVSFEIKDLSNANFTAIVGNSLISACGYAEDTQTVSLNSGDTYLWRPVMYSSATSTIAIYGDYYTLYASSTLPLDYNTAFVGGTVGTSTLPVTTNLLSFLNVPVLLETKFPFAYVFQIANGIKAGIAASSSNAIPSGDFVWRNVQGGTTTIDMFSQATIEYYLSPTLISLWRSFLVVLLYVGVGYALYHRARKDLNLK